MRLIICFLILNYSLAYGSPLRQLYSECQIKNKKFFEDSISIVKKDKKSLLAKLIHPEITYSNLTKSDLRLLCGSFLFDYRVSRNVEQLENWKRCIATLQERFPKKDIDLVYRCLKKLGH